MLVIEQLIVPIELHSIYFPTKSMGTNNYLVIQNIFVCVQHKRETHTGLERLEGE